MLCTVRQNIYRLPECRANEQVPAINPIECFEGITGESILAVKLQDIYGRINNIDAVVGLLAEEKNDGAFLPRTIAKIILDEYTRKRNADRFWYENDQFSDSEIHEIRERDFSDVVRDNLLAPGSSVASHYDNKVYI